MDEFSNRHMNDASFTSCAMARTRFVDVNLAGLTVENANIKGFRIFGYDVEAWISEQRAKDGCHLD